MITKGQIKEAFIEAYFIETHRQSARSVQDMRFKIGEQNDGTFTISLCDAMYSLNVWEEMKVGGIISSVELKKCLETILNCQIDERFSTYERIKKTTLGENYSKINSNELWSYVLINITIIGVEKGESLIATSIPYPEEKPKTFEAKIETVIEAEKNVLKTQIPSMNFPEIATPTNEFRWNGSSGVPVLEQKWLHGAINKESTPHWRPIPMYKEKN